ncbi:hypothetical protein RRG08_055048 [Elysia crispata]|uniref:Uncharacterized protein n=1 Tax=Elysia crispata TaxID=231223 RepID=A0AAE1AZH2_9GAST|nr:hypothetical protein RRG08_055048 [Elysia crispata]
MRFLRISPGSQLAGNELSLRSVEKTKLETRTVQLTPGTNISGSVSVSSSEMVLAGSPGVSSVLSYRPAH